MENKVLHMDGSALAPALTSLGDIFSDSFGSPASNFGLFASLGADGCTNSSPVSLSCEKKKNVNPELREGRTATRRFLSRRWIQRKSNLEFSQNI